MRYVASRPIRIVVSLVAVFAIPSGFCFAWHGSNGMHFGHTRYMWSRTWHAQNSLATPLNQYYVPRSPGYCGSGAYGEDRNGPVAGITGQYGASGYPVEAVAGFEPVQFERLGQVPNELDIIGNMNAPPAAPASAPRR